MNGALHTILSSMLVGATVRNLPIPRIFECDAIVILPILYDIEKSLIAVSFHLLCCHYPLLIIFISIVFSEVIGLPPASFSTESLYII